MISRKLHNLGGDIVKIIGLVIAALLGCVTVGFYAKEQIEQSHINALTVQEKCAMQARRYLADHQAKGDDFPATLRLNHYNRGVEKCLAFIDKEDPGDRGIMDTTSIYDAFEGRLLARVEYKAGEKDYDIKECFEFAADGTRSSCKTMDEFNEIQRRLMN